MLNDQTPAVPWIATSVAAFYMLNLRRTLPTCGARARNLKASFLPLTVRPRGACSYVKWLRLSYKVVFFFRPSSLATAFLERTVFCDSLKSPLVEKSCEHAVSDVTPSNGIYFYFTKKHLYTSSIFREPHGNAPLV